MGQDIPISQYNSGNTTYLLIYAILRLHKGGKQSTIINVREPESKGPVG